MSSFNPNDVPLQNSGMFGLPFSKEESRLTLLPVPWDVTTSYGGGTSRGPETILQASSQIDLFDLELGKAYETGYWMEPISQDWLKRNDQARAKALSFREAGGLHYVKADKLLVEVNAESDALNKWVLDESRKILGEGRLLGLVGGDHSCPYGSIQAVSERVGGDFGILHVDAHADLRNAYEGFNHSHASIMYNVMIAGHAPKRLVQVGIRDFCEEEYNFIRDSDGRIETFFDHDLKMRRMRGESWLTTCDAIMAKLPRQVYVSFDIDGLDPKLCPNTGTPVPGGLEFSEATALIASLHRHGKRIVGFDLNEVSHGGGDDEWDGNVGARLLYKLCGWAAVTNGLCEPGPKGLLA